jgi:hypothetical protein
MMPQQLFAAKASVRVKTKKELAEELALYHARTPGTSYEALGGDAMHQLISGVTGIDLKNLNAPRRGMIINAHHKLFEAQQAQVLAEVRAALEEARRLRLASIDSGIIEDPVVRPPRFALSTDGGSQGKQNYLHISLFLLVNGNIKEWALELAPFPHPHTSERYFEVLETTVSSALGAQAKGFFTSDNCPSMIKVGALSSRFIRVFCTSHSWATSWLHAKVHNAAERREAARGAAAAAAGAARAAAAHAAAAAALQAGAAAGLAHPLLAAGAAVVQGAGGGAGGAGGAGGGAAAGAGGIGAGAPVPPVVPEARLTSLGQLLHRSSLLARLVAGGTYAFQTFQAHMRKAEEGGANFGRIKGPLPFYAPKWGYEHSAALRLIELLPALKLVNPMDTSYGLDRAKRDAFGRLLTVVVEDDLPAYLAVAPLITRMGTWQRLLTSHRSPTSSLVLFALEDIGSMIEDGMRRIHKGGQNPRPRARALLECLAKGWEGVGLHKEAQETDHYQWASALDPRVCPFMAKGAEYLSSLETHCKTFQTGWFPSAHVQAVQPKKGAPVNPFAAAAHEKDASSSTPLASAFSEYRHQLSNIYTRAKGGMQQGGAQAAAAAAQQPPDPGIMSSVDPLEWYKSTAVSFPHLRLLLHGPVADLLQRPAVSTSSESAFSTVRAAVPFQRSNVSARTVQEEVLTAIRIRPVRPRAKVVLPVIFTFLSEAQKLALWDSAPLGPNGMPVVAAAAAARVPAQGGGGAAAEGGGAAAAVVIVEDEDVNRPILPGAAGDAAEAALLLDDDEGPPPLVDDEFDHCWAAAKAEAEEQAALLQLDPGDRGDGPVPTTSVIFANAVAELDMLGTYLEAEGEKAGRERGREGGRETRLISVYFAALEHVSGVCRSCSRSSIVMYNFGVGPRFAYVSASARAPK